MHQALHDAAEALCTTPARRVSTTGRVHAQRPLRQTLRISTAATAGRVAFPRRRPCPRTLVVTSAAQSDGSSKSKDDDGASGSKGDRSTTPDAQQIGSFPHRWDKSAIDVTATTSEAEAGGGASEDADGQDEKPWIRDISAERPPPEMPSPRAASVLRFVRPLSVLPYGVAILILLSGTAGFPVIMGISAEEVIAYSAAYMLFESAMRMQRAIRRAADCLYRIPIEEAVRDELLVGSAAGNAEKASEAYKRLRKIMLAIVAVAPIELAAAVLAGIAPNPASGAALLQLAQMPVWGLSAWRLSAGGAILLRPQHTRDKSVRSIAAGATAAAVFSAMLAFNAPYVAGASALAFAGVVLWQAIHEREVDDTEDAEDADGAPPPPSADIRFKPIPIQ